MANEQQANVLSDARTFATDMHNLIYRGIQLRDRFNALGGTGGFEGAGKLFAADGSGQEIPYSDFLGQFNAEGALELRSEWSAYIAQLARNRV